MKRMRTIMLSLAVSGATMSNQGIIDAVVDVVSWVGEDVEACKSAPVAVKEAGEKIEKTVDVVVAGGAGIAVQLRMVCL